MERVRRASRITCLWPGLARLWHSGDFSSLLEAIAFAALLNLALLASFFRADAVSHVWRLGFWVSVAVFWGSGVWRGLRQHTPAGDAEWAQGQQDLFIRAQTEYLRGHWVEAQTVLEQLIRRDPEDVESHLLLASVYRRTQRLDLSRCQLRQLEDFQGAARWRFEIRRELAAIDKPAAITA
ncbi:MAG: tetratricopeptide repeat protein [Pirellulaceae bacterium]